jgi:hypothetical protein
MALFFVIFSSLLALSLALTGLLYLLRRRSKAAGLAIEHLHPSVFSFFTTIYAFFLGFAIVTLWSAFLTAQTNVTREADSLLVAFRLSHTLPDSGAFRRSLADYTRSVVRDEWPTMAAHDTMSEKTQKSLEKLWDNFILLKPVDKSDQDIYLEIGNRLSEASQQRLSRAILTQGNLYPPIWVIIIFGFLTVLFGLYYNHLQQNPVRLCFDFMVIFVVLCCIYFIYDIDTPFSGYVVVKADIFKLIHARMLALQ